MTKRSANPSLLPYLQGGGGGVRLSFSQNSTASVSQQGQASFPFLQVDPSDPLARIIDGRFVTDTGSTIKRVFLAIQRDAYRFSQNALWPRTNVHIDRHWQRAYLRRHEASDEGFITFPEQTGSDGRPVPFRSLFFCCLKGLFFHPPCPVCGAYLAPCYDDALLEATGLKAYKTSLARYLFCPTCKELAGETGFYAFSRQDEEPEVVKDRWELIRELGTLSSDVATELPCSGCEHHEDCYGSQGLVATRMSPALFYPFYLLVFEAMSLKGIDFLALVSGAPLDELENRDSGVRNICLERLSETCEGQVPALVIAENGRFLETLFLKLSFLGELFAGLSKQLDRLEWPDLGPTLDGVWVRLGKESGRLPFLWNFRVQAIGIGGEAGAAEGLPRAPRAFGLHFMGLCWFYALVVNERQGMGQVLDVLGRGSDESGNPVPWETLVDEPVVAPTNIFWKGEGKPGTELGDREVALWRDSLKLGHDFLAAALRPEDWSQERFWDRWKELTDKTRAALFSEKKGPVPEGAVREDTGKTVIPETTGEERDGGAYELVRAVVSKWRDDLTRTGDNQEVVKTPPHPEGRDGLAETVVMSVSSDGPSEPAAGGVPEDDDAHEETVILSAGSFGDIPTAGANQRSEGLEETVVLTQEAAPEVDTGPAERQYNEDSLTETVVISPSAGQGAGRVSEASMAEPKPREGSHVTKGKGESSVTGDTGAGDVEEMEETVILKPQPSGGKD